MVVSEMGEMWSPQTAPASVALMQAHLAEVDEKEAREEDHDQRQDRVEVIRNGRAEHLEAVDVIALGDVAADGCRPAGDRGKNAHGRGGRVDDIGQLCARHMILVGDRAHDVADRQAVEIVVDKNQDAERRGRQHGASLALDALARPCTVGHGSAGLCQQNNDHAEQNVEDQDVQVHIFCHGSEQPLKASPRDVSDRRPQAEPFGHKRNGNEHCRQQASGKQRAVDLFGYQCQHNCHKRRDDRPSCTDEHNTTTSSICDKTKSCRT